MTIRAPANQSVVKGAEGRRRLLEAAYKLFSRNGIKQVGIDTILEASGCAKATLYYNFRSKEELALAFLDMREDLWTRGWLESTIRRRTNDPEERLLLVFDIFDEWFHRRDFEGCSFINALVETDAGSRIHRAAADHLAHMRDFLIDAATESKLKDPERFAESWHILMKGSIVAACEGRANAARDALQAARIVLQGWPRIGS